MSSRPRSRNLIRDLTIVKRLSEGKTFRRIGTELNLSGARVHQIYKRTLHDIYLTAGRTTGAPEKMRGVLQAHPVMVERILEDYAREHADD